MSIACCAVNFRSRLSSSRSDSLNASGSASRSRRSRSALIQFRNVLSLTPRLRGNFSSRPARAAHQLHRFATELGRILRWATQRGLLSLASPPESSVHTNGSTPHVDIKKLGRIPKGGGWRAHSRAVSRGQHHRTKVGYAFVHSAVDAHSRIAYSEVLQNEQGVTAAGFWTRAAAFYAELGIVIERELTDNGPCYKSRAFSRCSRRRSPTSSFAPTVRSQRQSRALQPHLLAEWA